MHQDMRPLGVGEALDAAIAVCTRSYRPLVTIAALVMLPVQALSTLVMMSAGVTAAPTGSFSYNISGAGEEVTSAGATIAAVVIVSLLGLLANAVATAASTKLVADTYLAEPSTAGDSIRFAARRTAALLGAAALAALGIAIGLNFCALPGLWLAVAWSVYVPVLLVEGIGPVDALKRSFGLTRSRWFTTAALLFVTALLEQTLSLLLNGVGWLVLHSNPYDGAHQVLNGVVQGIATTLTLPISVAAVIVWYFDLRVRSEGFDVWMMIRRLDRVPASS